MDPITLIVAALAAGASTGISGVASDAVAGAFEALKASIKRVVSDPSADLLLQKHQADPDIWEQPVRQLLADANAQDAQEVIHNAEEVLAIADPTGTASGKYAVDLRGAKGVQVGDRNTQNNTFGRTE